MSSCNLLTMLAQINRPLASRAFCRVVACCRPFVVTMGFTAGLIGAAAGFSVQMFANATKKVPLSRGESVCSIR